MTFMQLWVDRCPDCEIKITLEGELQLGRLLVCPSCGTNLGFVETAFTELGSAFERGREEYGGLQVERLDADWEWQALPVPS
jgi:hypothetical protein